MKGYHTGLNVLCHTRDIVQVLNESVKITSLHGKIKPSIYFALSNVQFTTPQLVNVGVAAEQAGFDGFGQVIAFNHGNRTKGMLAPHGCCLLP